MELEMARSCDVLVIGAGIAGIRAAISAAGAGRRVLLACRGNIFSGSSFYPGTWGLGLIGPESEADEADLIESILDVGRGMADRELVTSFVRGITPAVQELTAMGVRLKEARDQSQREFIPCFDHKHRAWHGLRFDSLREVCGRELERRGIALLPQSELIELTRWEGRVSGVVLWSGGQFVWVKSGAVVLASGGTGGLYQRRLTTGDVCGTGQWLAAKAGASLVNLEFMQIMPGYFHPCPNTIFNEKVFRWAHITDEQGAEIISDPGLLEERSGHGPFTSRLADRAVDLAILEHQGETGVEVQYRFAAGGPLPEFVKTYFDWLEREKGLTAGDPVFIGMFAHASNGGVQIDSQGWTGVPGLYAAGEVTGGMHGADRIGGLSTANGLVFGGRAGLAAAAACSDPPQKTQPFARWHIPEASRKGELLRSLMTRHALVLRSREGLEHALKQVESLRKGPREPGGSLEEAAASRRLEAQLGTAWCVLHAQLRRTESRGSHFRADYPQEDPAQAKPVCIQLSNTGGDFDDLYES
ncbi:MAG: FAD-binding protein [Oscillospiraceae bacterium]|nr:FAD-binding protein [Oscillospiraceae bacterium]